MFGCLVAGAVNRNWCQVFMRMNEKWYKSEDVPARVPPEPILQLSLDEGALTYPTPDQRRDTPAWAKPIMLSAYKNLGLMK